MIIYKKTAAEFLHYRLFVFYEVSMRRTPSPSRPILFLVSPPSRVLKNASAIKRLSKLHIKN